jgi:hypothetical protein
MEPSFYVRGSGMRLANSAFQPSVVVLLTGSFIDLSPLREYFSYVGSAAKLPAPKYGAFDARTSRSACIVIFARIQD